MLWASTGSGVMATVPKPPRMAAIRRISATLRALARRTTRRIDHTQVSMISRTAAVVLNGPIAQTKITVDIDALTSGMSGCLMIALNSNLVASFSGSKGIRRSHQRLEMDGPKHKVGPKGTLIVQRRAKENGLGQPRSGWSVSVSG